MALLRSSMFYHPIDEAHIDENQGNFNRRSIFVLRSSWLSLWLIFITSLLALTAAFAAGMHQAHLYPPSDIDSIMKIETSSQILTYNQTFSKRPSPNSDSAWEAIFPLQGGFFRHPVIANERSAFSVFHQLHCLNGIRIAYWTLHDAAREGKTLQEEDIPMMSSERHVRHCIDLLRQTLMCNADFTVEKKDLGVGGVLGFGTEHQCRNWEQFLSWMAEWEVYGQADEK